MTERARNAAIMGEGFAETTLYQDIEAGWASESRVEKALSTMRIRLLLGVLVCLAMVCAIALRLVEVGLLSERELAEKQRRGTHAQSYSRAEILDRNGVVLATNLVTASLYANPSVIRDHHMAAKKLAKVLPGQSAAQILEKLENHKSFVWIKRNLTPKEQYAVNALGIPGLNFVNEERRVYPYRELFAHLVGFVSVDNQGMAGVEKRLNNALSGTEITAPEPVQLSIDIRVQGIVHEELSKAMEEFSAIGAVGVIADAKTGEIVSMVSLPDFDPHKPGKAPDEARFNRVTNGVYEMGSTFKAITLAMALDSGKVGLNDVIDASAPIRYAGFTIHDHHAKNRPLTVPEVFMYSSNIGTAKIAQMLGVKHHRQFLEHLGLMHPIDIGLPEMPRPLYPSAKNWSELSTLTISFGHGMSVSPAHMVQAVQAMVNDGMKVPLSVFKRAEEPAGEQILNPETSYRMRQLLRLVVEKGTGSKSEVAGYWVGGKTGTAEKITAHGYSSNASLSSFIGAFPIQDPKYVVLVMLDEPKGTKQTFGYATGGWTAAPTVSRIVARVGPMLGVKPEREIGKHLASLQPENKQPQTVGENGVNLAAYRIKH